MIGFIVTLALALLIFLAVVYHPYLAFAVGVVILTIVLFPVKVALFVGFIVGFPLAALAWAELTDGGYA